MPEQFRHVLQICTTHPEPRCSGVTQIVQPEIGDTHLPTNPEKSKRDIFRADFIAGGKYEIRGPCPIPRDGVKYLAGEAVEPHNAPVAILSLRKYDALPIPI